MTNNTQASQQVPSDKTVLEPCDCTAYCGDDRRINAGKVAPCKYAEKPRENKVALSTGLINKVAKASTTHHDDGTSCVDLYYFAHSIARAVLAAATPGQVEAVRVPIKACGNCKHGALAPTEACQNCFSAPDQLFTNKLQKWEPLESASVSEQKGEANG